MTSSERRSRIELQQRLWDECDESEKDASEWEGKFLSSIADGVTRGALLTDRQFATLQDVHRKLVS